MASPTEKLVPITLTFVTLENGEPVEKEEEWYAYFTMGTMSEMYKRLDVPENKAKKLAKETQENADDPEEGAEEFQEEILSKVETTEFEANIMLVWASLQWHARQKGKELTIQEVGDLITSDNAEYLITQVMRAFEAFQTGEVPSMEEIERRREELEDESKEERAEGKGREDGAVPSSDQS